MYVQEQTLLVHTNLKKLSQDIRIYYLVSNHNLKMYSKIYYQKYKIKNSCCHSNTLYETDM